jgi:L-lactate dehydrogenase complex protein LldF
MSTHVPPVHIAVMGIEKVLERLDDVPPLLTLLTRSATGQPISTYLNMITAPRAPHEKDGPREVHLVILDNGRSKIYADPELRTTLRCIRCGACMNHCPVYTRVGGHAYEAVYPGPIGKILTPQIENRPDLLDASSLCGACVEVCPVEIPITKLMVRLRGMHATRRESFAWKMWMRAFRSRRIYSLGTWMATRFRFLAPKSLRPARRTLHELARRGGVPDV